MSYEDVKSLPMTTKEGSNRPFENVVVYGQLPVSTAQDSPGSIFLHVSLPNSLSTNISSLNQNTTTTMDVPVIMIWPNVIPQNQIPINRWVLTKQGTKWPMVPVQGVSGCVNSLTFGRRIHFGWPQCMAIPAPRRNVLVMFQSYPRFHPTQ